MKDSNETLDFLLDLYKIININEQVFYKNNLIYNDKYYKNKIGKVIHYYFNLPDNYITVSKHGIVIEKLSVLLHNELINILCTVQKKHYLKEDKFGIKKNSNTITSLYEDTYYLCEVYTQKYNNNIKYVEWITNYCSDLVYLEAEDYKFYGGEKEKTINIKPNDFFKYLKR